MVQLHTPLQQPWTVLFPSSAVVPCSLAFWKVIHENFPPVGRPRTFAAVPDVGFLRSDGVENARNSLLNLSHALL